jgi:hypothetical protein
MNPFLFLAIPCLGMALAGSALNHTLDAQWRQWKREHNKTHSLVAHIASVQRDSRENGPCCSDFIVRERLLEAR